MADGVDTSFYKPRPRQDPLETVSKFGNAANALAPLVVGGAMQQSIDPKTGSVDQQRLLGLLRQSPVGAAQAVPTMDALAKLRQAGYTADQAGLEAFQKRMAITYHLFSGLASKKNPTMGDVYDVAAQAMDPALNGKSVGITLPVIMNAVKQFQGLPPDQIKKKALQLQTMAASTAEILGAHAPRYQVFNQGGQFTVVPMGTTAEPAMGTAVPSTLPPTTRIPTSGGPQFLGPQPAIPGGGAVTGEGTPAVPAAGGAVPLPGAPAPRGPMAGFPPGYEAAAGGIAGQSAASANELTQANDTSPNRLAILGNLEDLLQRFDPGKAADWTLVAKNFANRNLPVPKSWQERGGILDIKSVASQEEFNKLAVQLAQNQFAAIGGTGTDAKFSSAFETSPNETLSALGNTQIIRLLKGNELAIRAKNKAWQDWLKSGNGPQTYPQFSQRFNEHFDPRAFQFKYVPPKDRQEYIDNMDENDRGKFLRDLTYARKQGWITFDTSKAKK